jgi:hypothetical protein
VVGVDWVVLGPLAVVVELLFVAYALAAAIRTMITRAPMAVAAFPVLGRAGSL